MTVEPHDPVAEASVLGAILISPAAMASVEEILQPEDFYRPNHEAIYACALSLSSRGEPTDANTVYDELRTRGLLDRVGGPAYLYKLASEVPTAANAAFYAQIVAERGQLRRLASAGARISQMARAGLDGQGGGEVEAIVAEAHAEMAKLSGDTRASQDAANFGERVDEIIAALDEPLSDPGQDYVMTGFTDMDRLFAGFRPGQITIVAGRPGIGKSTLAADVARHAAFTQGRRVLFHTLEMSREELELRILAAQCRVDLKRIRQRLLSLEEVERIGRTREVMDGCSFVIDGTPTLTLASLRASIRRNQPDLVIVDQLQLVTPMSTRKRGSESRQEEVGAISRGMKLMAKAEGVPFVVCAKLNRGPEQRTDKKPQMSDLRDSGDIESDADNIILLHREDAYENESPRAGEADLIVAKHRNGPTDTITVAFQGHYSRFVDMATGLPDPPPVKAEWSPSDALRLVQ